MALTFTVGSGGIPAGVYPETEFIGAEEFQSDNSEYGPGVRLKFKVLSGAQAGNETSRICSQKLSPKSNLMLFVKALAGREPAPGEQITLDAFIGTRGCCVVEATPNGGTRVSTFVRSTPAAAPAVAAAAPAANDNPPF